MAYLFNLKRNPALTNDLIGTPLGTATLQSKDNEKVQVPLAPLLSTSKLIRTMVAESYLHPATHGPLILSCEVSTEALVSVGDILGTGETCNNNDNIEEIKQGLSMLGVEADLSQDRKNEEYFELISARDGDVKLEKIIEMQVDNNENCANGIDKDLYNSVKKEIRVKDTGNEDQQEFDNIGKKKDMNNKRRNFVHEHYTINGEEIKVKPKNDEVDCEIGNHEPDQIYALENYEVNVLKLRKFHEKTYQTDKTYDEEKLLKCKICHYSASQLSDLKRHMRSHTGEKPYTCAICSSAFSRKHHLKNHMRRHTGEKPFTCAICSSAFSRKQHLIVHIRSHTGEKPFNCSMCSSAFRQKNDLKDHMRVHTGEKPYACAICSSAFRQKAHLEVHMRSHTGEKPYTCTICSSAFRQKAHLKDHMRMHTGEKPYTCTVCASAFGHKRSLVVHMKKHMGENPSECEYASATSKEFQ